jgi:uncharacterized protein
MKNLTLSEIWIYPIKSLGGIRLSRAKVFEKGLEYDRRWMLIDEKGQFMTQRVYHQMALFKQQIDGDDLVVQFDTDILRISLQVSFIDIPLRSNVWDDAVTVFEVKKVYSAWFSKRLGIACRLVVFPELNVRPVDKQYKINDEHVSLADAYPFLIIGQSSLNDLNVRLAEPVSINRFRPNFVFTGGEPYEEDGWKSFTIGNNRFVGVKPCSRCIMTTVNQDTAEKGREPLLTLSKYRKQGEKILFGQNVIAIDHHEIYEGDTIILQ